VKIFYGICGEGMGHAGRSIALIERLAALGHRVTIFTFADALQLLSRSGYRPHRIDGLKFSMTPGGGVNPLGTFFNFTSFVRYRDESLDLIRQLALAERPDLFITDFEPLTAQAAASLGIPCASVDNQHKFCAPMEDGLPRSLRLYSRLAGAFVARWIKNPRPCIVAVFHHCPPTARFHRVNTLLRDRMARLKPTAGDHVLIYGRQSIGEQMARAAASVRKRFIVYGCDGPPFDNLEYKPISYDEFAADMASCKAVICTAGQQLIGEAAYFGKPVLVVPIPCQHEQSINAHFARLDGLGDYCPADQLSSSRIERFLRQEFRKRPAINGLDQTIELLDVHHESAVA
jgi:uncharacterized protein (TIGR00661 family)